MITADDFIKNGFLSSANSVQEFEGRWNYRKNPGNHPILPPISDEDKANLDLALRYLQQNPRAAEVLNKAISNGIGIVAIKDYDAFHNGLRYENPDGVIFWNPKASLEFIFIDNQGNYVSRGQQSPANVLLHEFIHATDPNLHASEETAKKHRGLFAENDSLYKYQSGSEMRAVCEANALVSAQHGELIRNSYRGLNQNNPLHKKHGITDTISFAHMPSTSPIDFHNRIYNPDTGKLQYEVRQSYDAQSGTVTRILTNHDVRVNGMPMTETEKLDLDGKRIEQGATQLGETILSVNRQQQDPACRSVPTDLEQVAPEAEAPEKVAAHINAPVSSLSHLAAMVLNGSREDRDEMGRQIASSPLGEQFRQRGEELQQAHREEQLALQQQQMQEAREQQEAQVRRGPVMH